MEPIVIVVGKDEKITKEMLERYVKEAYEKGYEKGKADGYHTVPLCYDRCYNCPWKNNLTYTWTATSTDALPNISYTTGASTATAKGVEL